MKSIGIISMTTDESIILPEVPRRSPVEKSEKILKKR